MGMVIVSEKLLNAMNVKALVEFESETMMTRLLVMVKLHLGMAKKPLLEMVMDWLRVMLMELVLRIA